MSLWRFNSSTSCIPSPLEKLVERAYRHRRQTGFLRGRNPLIKIIVQRLIRAAKLNHVFYHIFGRAFFHKHLEINSAICSISFSRIPKRVTSIVPIRNPLGASKSAGVSPGIKFLFAIKFARQFPPLDCLSAPMKETAVTGWRMCRIDDRHAAHSMLP